MIRVFICAILWGRWTANYLPNPFGINKIWVQVKEESRIFLELHYICWWHGRTYCLTLTIANLFFPQTNLTLTQFLFKEKTLHSMICSLLLLVAKWQKITTTKKKKKKRKHTHTNHDHLAFWVLTFLAAKVQERILIFL